MFLCLHETPVLTLSARRLGLASHRVHLPMDVLASSRLGELVHHVTTVTELTSTA